jgi:hypothetical protein
MERQPLGCLFSSSKMEVKVTNMLSFRFALKHAPVLCGALLLAGCGGGTANVSAPGSAPAIFEQPSDASVPMGLAGTFSVTASGNDLSYQWSRSGTVIQGATASTYSTPPTAFTDSGETFSVKVSNAAGSAISRTANLTVTARAPKAGDLRFQQVDAPSTVNGYAQAGSAISSVECPPPGDGGGYLTFSGGAGATFELSNNACEWDFFVYGSTPVTNDLSAAYEVDSLSNLQQDLSQSISGIPAPNDTGSVVISAGVGGRGA